MNTKAAIVIYILLIVGLHSIKASAQTHPDFTIIKSIPTTPVKNQNQTGTCWSFATVSFLETEAIRMGKPALDLSEMYIVKHLYPEKAEKYVRYHGLYNFSEGGQAHDVINAIQKYGIVPNESFTGLLNGKTAHNHGDMYNSLNTILKAVVNPAQGIIQSDWHQQFDSVLNANLGKCPEKVDYSGKQYDPKTFAKDVLGFNPDNYVELTSYKNYPYNQKIDLELPDNWSHGLYYNISIADLMSVIDNSLNKGYSIAWDGDVSESNFKSGMGVATISGTDEEEIKNKGIEEYRQTTFNIYSTTDDHLMHITGTAKDKEGKMFYLTKNSWGEKGNKYGGYLYMSDSYVQLKTVAILVNKDVIPTKIKKKLGI